MPRRRIQTLSLTDAKERGERWWLGSKRKTAQHWYVSFCLLLSAIQDHLTGISLRNNRNLNWSVTANYYSIVHSVRMLFFLYFGDFPTSHSALRGLGANHRNGHIRLNWLSQFCSELDEPNIPESVNILISDAKQVVDPQTRIGPLISSLGKLRNDSNYEALLMAHEQQHRYVTELFISLADLSKSASDNILEVALERYLSSVSHNLWGLWDAGVLKAMSNSYVTDRLFLNLRAKFVDADIHSKLDGINQKLTVQCDRDNSMDDECDEFERDIRMEQFEGKTSLMRSFNDKISILESALSQEDTI